MAAEQIDKTAELAGYEYESLCQTTDNEIVGSLMRSMNQLTHEFRDREELKFFAEGAGKVTLAGSAAGSDEKEQPTKVSDLLYDHTAAVELKIREAICGVLDRSNETAEDYTHNEVILKEGRPVLYISFWRDLGSEEPEHTPPTIHSLFAFNDFAQTEEGQAFIRTYLRDNIFYGSKVPSENVPDAAATLDSVPASIFEPFIQQVAEPV